MASKAKAVKFKIVEAQVVVMAAPPVVAEATQEVEQKAVYAFPTKSRCEKCGTLATRRRGVSRDGGSQYRECLKPSCRRKYSIAGVRV